MYTRIRGKSRGYRLRESQVTNSNGSFLYPQVVACFRDIIRGEKKVNSPKQPPDTLPNYLVFYYYYSRNIVHQRKLSHR